MPTFHFSLGPVQEFVSQARRSNDFWAGSFLLSWLAGVAMCAVRAQGGEIIFPHPPPAYLDWINGRAKPQQSQSMARVGAIPNRFAASLSPACAAHFQGAQVACAVRQSWQALAAHTLRADGITLDARSRQVWQRQIEDGTLWEVQWLLSPDQDGVDFNALDQRKHWRSQLPPPEPGAKCTLMHGWQELSGAAYDQIDAFWQKLRQQLRAGRHDLGENEYLCAPALVKRRFAHHFADLRHTLDNGQQVCGWPLAANVPSTYHLAALPWLAQLLRTASGQTLHELLQLAQACQIGSNERRNPPLLRLQQALDARASNRTVQEAENAAEPGIAQEVASLDAGIFFATDAVQLSQLSQQTRLAAPESASAQCQALYACLTAIKRQHGPAHSFYALLLMDGDALGQQIAQHAPALALALKAFTASVAQIVQQCSGFLVYAGGDDVLALLPADAALFCAARLRRSYLQAFHTHAPALAQPSISASLVFAHHKIPLTQILHDAHQVLHEVAKQGHGRDSLALRVWKSSGLHLSWGMPWDQALQANTDQFHLCALARRLQQEPGLFSQGFFQRAQRCYQELANLHDLDLMREMLVYEYGHSLQAERHAADKAQIEALIHPLFVQSQIWRRSLSASGVPQIQAQGLPQADAALLMGFLLEYAPGALCESLP